MSGKTYVGNTSGKAVKPSKIYAGNSSGKAQAVKAVYVGNSSGKAVKVWPESDIPDTNYQQVEYIRNNNYGYQYINTGIIPDYKTRVVLDVLYYSKRSYSTASSNIEYSFGTTKYHIGVFNVQRHDNTMYHLIDYPGFYTNELEITFGSRIIYDINNNNEFFINNQKIGSSSDTGSERTNPYILFGMSHGIEKGYTSAGVDKLRLISINLYNCKIYQGLNSTLVRDFYPCYRINDEKPGLYDVINENFYTNAHDDNHPFYVGPKV